ncbi:acetyl-coenzyme-A carboxylase [Mucor velutinosus]|uniref:Acetyl-coenzyme-A carboxylase n=2 Tax=Mucor TaxID=4830 RepID=A0AAN7HSE4_9FUNG|nr:acetyl-coenzyme-A carboxylase [Mucor velutinosus]
MAPSTSTATVTTTTTSSGAPVEGARRRSLSGASALLARRFTRNTASASPSSSSSAAADPRPTASRSESTAKRRATIASSASSSLDQHTNDKVHVRIVPNIDNPSRSLIFDIVDRQLPVGSIIRIGRYSERHANLNCMSFKSKVVSRCHCEVWVETDGKLYIRDTKSSSGTFLNHVRLSPAGSESRPVELHDGDIVQLGVDFQGGREEMYRSVKMRFELNRSSRQRPLSFNLNAFQNLRNLTQATAPTPPLSSHHQHQQHQEESANLRNTIIDTPTNDLINSPPASDGIPLKKLTNMQTSNDTTITTTTSSCHDDVDECCICLYALAPFQALFVSPCSHTYHFKCIRPLLQSYPGFQCPICRTYSDLEASVASEADEVINIFRTGSSSNSNNKHHERSITVTTAPPADSGLNLQSPESSDFALHNPLHVADPYSTTLVSSPVIYSETLPDPFSSSTSSPANQNHTVQILQHVIEESAPHASSPQAQIETEQAVGEEEDHGVLSNTEDEEDDVEVEDVDMSNLSSAEPTATRVQSRPTSTSTPPAIPKRERRSSHIMDKLKMVFFEKRKSASTTQQQQNKQLRHSHKRRARPLSYPNLLSVAADEQPPSLPPHAENQRPLLPQVQGH